MCQYDKNYDVLTIDTSIFEQYGLKINKGLLAKLEQFNNEPIDFILSDIIFLEVESHLIKKENETKGKLSSVLRESIDYLHVNEEEINTISLSLGLKQSEENLSTKKLKDFLDRCGVEIIESQKYCSMDELVKSYFSKSPPFKETGKKKSEFPDAISLLSLVSWANFNNKKILAVSLDDDWEAFARGKESIDVIRDLPQAIEIFNTQKDKALNKIIEEIRDSLKFSSSSDIYRKIYDELESSLNLGYIDAVSAYNYFIDDDEVILSDLEILSESGELKVHLVESLPNSITISIKCRVYCEVNVSFNFFARDHIDKEDIDLGYITKTSETSYVTDILISLDGNFLNGLSKMEIASIEITDNLDYIDMGEISPFDNENF